MPLSGSCVLILGFEQAQNHCHSLPGLPWTVTLTADRACNYCGSPGSLQCEVLS
ncbi:rCG21955 [Rattus norvegicus]|uniref:RCG21955 n=1 Tax=Rattus norvegicus TaxID=10116 RepID=A6K493_RAT|nr:rCG21955 [Rattus norvegicus]